MLKKKTFFWVGLVFLLGLAGFYVMLGQLEKGLDREGAYEVYGVFSDATGLVKNSRVMLSGIPVGEISQIGLDPDRPDMARVTIVVKGDIKLYEGLEDPVTGAWKNGATAMRKQASLLGDYYISLSPGVSGALLGDGDEIHNIVTESGLGAVLKQFETSTSRIFPKLEAITDDIKAITGSVRETIGDEEGTASLKQIREDIAKSAQNIERLSAEARSFMQGEIYPEAKTIRSILANVDVTTARLRSAAERSSRQLDGILGNAETLTADLRRFIGDQTAPPGQAKDGTIAKTLAKLDKNMTLLEGSLESVKSVTAKVDQGEGTVGRLLNDDKLINDFEKIVSDIGDFTGRFNRVQVDVEFRSEYNFGAAAMKHYVNLKLRPKPDKYYFFQVIDDPRGVVERVKRVTTSNDPAKPPTLTETIVTTRSELKFTAQFAKRWHFLTFRYGLMESTGGWGVDAELLDDALRFKLDVFDFDFQALPRVRLLAAWNFVKHIYVAAGMDDILNNPGRDYFIGLGVTFTDGDLKSILPLAPVP